LTVLVHHLPQDSATRRALDAQSVWGLNEQLLANIADTLRAANWQRGGKGSRPKPIPRPGVTGTKRRHFGRATRPPHEIAAYLARFKPPVVTDGS
jgi:hypothetical protein